MSGAQRWPAHAHVPGKNARHAEDAFAELRASVGKDMSAAALAGCAAFGHGVAYLRGGYYWEAHELLEAVWMALPESEERRFVQGLIQTANAYLKFRMGRPKAVRRLCGIARQLLSSGSSPVIMRLDRRELLGMIDALECALETMRRSPGGLGRARSAPTARCGATTAAGAATAAWNVSGSDKRFYRAVRAAGCSAPGRDGGE